MARGINFEFGKTLFQMRINYLELVLIATTLVSTVLWFKLPNEREIFRYRTMVMRLSVDFMSNHRAHAEHATASCFQCY